MLKRENVVFIGRRGVMGMLRGLIYGGLRSKEVYGCTIRRGKMSEDFFEKTKLANL